MSRSVVVDVRKAVIAGIKDAVNDRKVSVTYGWEGGDEARHREEIYTNRPRATHEPAVLRSGHTVRTERMEFDVVILVINPKGKAEDVDERALELGQFVEEFVAESKGTTLGVTGLNWLIVSGFEMENRLMKTGSASLAQYTLSYEARLD